MKSFDLLTEPWIPVLWDPKQPSAGNRIGLRELFERAQEIRDLALPPLQRIAIMRLLIAITQAALDGPTDDDDWLTCRERIIPGVLDYLRRWSDRFDLFGDKPFLQVADLQPSPGKSAEDLSPLDKLNFAWAAGNAHTLFDHAALGDRGPISLPDLALFLVAFQSFHPGGLLGSGVWNGQTTSRSTTQAPCVENSALLSLLLGDSLLETIHLNLIPKRRLEPMAFGRPIWEFYPLPTPDSPQAAEIARSYLGRLVPLARAIKIFPDHNACIITKGYEYPKFPEIREPMATVVLRADKKDRTYLRINPDRHPWRDLYAVLQLQGASGTGGPLSLANVHLLCKPGHDRPIDLWVGGLNADQAKLIDAREWLFSFKPSMLGQLNLAVYEKGVLGANLVEQSLRNAVRAYCERLSLESGNYTPRATSAYWSALDNHYHELIAVAEQAADLEPWRRRCYSVAFTVYATICPAETPRQIEAFVNGRRMFFATRKKGAPT